MNVGIQDAHNLTWKLAAVLKVWDAPALLESYGTERAPISRAIVEQMGRNSQTMQKVVISGGGQLGKTRSAQTPPERPELGREHGLVFGTVYDSPVITADGKMPVQVIDPVHSYIPNAYPGIRAPHVWLECAGEKLSTLDLFGRAFILLAGSQGQSWLDSERALHALLVSRFNHSKSAWVETWLI